VGVLTGVVIAQELEPARRFWRGANPTAGGLAVVANRTLLSRAVETLRLAGAGRIVVVCDRDAEPVLRSTMAAEAGALEWRGVVGTPEPAAAVLRAHDEFDGDRYLLHTTTGLWLDGALDKLATLASEHDALVLVAPTPRRRSTTGSGGQFRVGGLHAVNGRVIAALRAQTGDQKGERLLAAIDTVADDGGIVHALMTDSWWFYSGDPDDQLAVNRAALDTLEAGRRGALPPNRIEGRVVIHESARVEDSTIRGPAIIGAEARVLDAYIGPYTSVGEAATVENSEIENSIVHTGASIRDLGVRLESSVIGQGASLGRSLDLPRAARVVVGEDASITLA
jgi:carbonic anhydrase/acetyltransferase-like protein (isoleucine patch superfamily)